LTGILSEVAELDHRAAEAERHLTDARHERARLQAMADLGQTSMRLARETAGSLASVTGFARRVQRRLEAEDPNREYLEIVVREGERIEKLVREHLQFASLQRPRLGMSSLNHLLQAALDKVTPTIEKRRVRLLKKLDSNLPGFLLDEDKIEQAFINVVNSALEGVSNGGRLLVQSRCTREHAVVEVCHDGPPLSNDVLEQLFVPFGTGGRPGVGLGLALAMQIIRDHGGEIAVKARGDWGHITALSFPILDNADRRARIDRRHGRGRDRRNRFPLK